MFTLFCLTLAFAPLAFASVEPWAYGLLQLSVFSLAAAAYAKGRASAPNPFCRTLIPAVLAIAAIGLAQAQQQNPVNAPGALLFTAWRPATLTAAAKWLFYAATLALVPQLVNTPERFKRLLWAVFTMGVIVALLGMFQKSGDNTYIYGVRKVPGDAFGPFVNRDHGAHFLLMTAFVGLGLFFSGFRQLTAQQSHTRLFDLLAVQGLNLVMVAGLVFGIYRANSRAGLHAFAFTAALLGFTSGFFIKTRRFRWLAWGGVALLCAGYAAFVYYNPRMLGRQFDGFDVSVLYRFSMYRSSLEMLLDFPLFGVGLGAVEHAFPYYQEMARITGGNLVLHVHSDWIELFLQTGLAGGLLYLAALGAALWYALKTWRACGSFRLKALYGGALGAVIGAMLHNLVEFGSQMPANAFYFYTLLGALAARPPALPRHELAALDEEEADPPPRQRRLLAALAAALLAVAALPPAMGWYYNFRAKDAFYEAKTANLERALKWRKDPQYAFRLGAAHYNKAIKQKPPDPRLLAAARAAIAPYLAEAPVNYDLRNLHARIIALQARAADKK